VTLVQNRRGQLMAQPPSRCPNGHPLGPGQVRDGKIYFAVLLDDNNRKPIIRLNLNGKSVKFVTTFEQGKDVGVRRVISSVVDIYKVASEEIRQTIRRYESGGALSEVGSTDAP
jgi:hypothetical protein